MTMHYEIKRTGNEVVIAYLKVQYLPKGTEKNNENLKSR
jgi:hypothetical protein